MGGGESEGDGRTVNGLGVLTAPEGVSVGIFS